jgi:hypothetical protein
MEERLKREEEERVERRRRVEAIMSRTRVANRKSGIQDDNQQENLKNVQKQEEVSPSGEVIPTGLNNETFNNLQNSSIINNLTNNNTTTSNNSNSSTLISFDDNTNHQQFNNYNNQSRQDEVEILDGAFTTSATLTPTSVSHNTGGNSTLDLDSGVNNASSTDGAAAFPAPESAAATIQDLLS